MWGLDPSGKHGLFITELGIRGCNWSRRRSKHYNPYNASHGAARSCWRHVGDLDILQANAKGGANFSQFDARVQLQVCGVAKGGGGL
ncbi:MAG: superoxide dismutase family protein [Gammaproteobacteria bacterium]|nr:superoxide dismutase family protein [Gammaproteobacteria bacterium]